jgi:hypothetical protein
VSALDGAELALGGGRDGEFAAVAGEVRGPGVLGGAREAGGVGVKITVLYRVWPTAHLTTSFSRRKQKSQRGSFSLRAAFSIELSITCVGQRVLLSRGARRRRAWRPA